MTNFFFVEQRLSLIIIQNLCNNEAKTCYAMIKVFIWSIHTDDRFIWLKLLCNPFTNIIELARVVEYFIIIRQDQMSKKVSILVDPHFYSRDLSLLVNILQAIWKVFESISSKNWRGNVIREL